MSDLHPDSRHPWWKTAAGITALATIAAAVITGVFSLASSRSSEPTPPTAVPGTITTTTQVPPETATSELPPATTAPSSTPQVRRHEKLILTFDQQADLDALDRNWTPVSQGDWDILLGGHYVGGGSNLWITSRKKTDYEACADKSYIVKTGDLGLNDVRVEMNLCVMTNEGRLALLHIDRITKTADGFFGVMGYTVTVWEGESP